jgi:hypothetical protein
MTAKQQNKILQDQISNLLSILASKGHDYASESDVLEVFKKVGAVLDISPIDVCSVFAVTKIVRLNNLLSNGEAPNNESIRDSFRDLQAYSLLMEQCYLDSQPAPSFKPSNDWD